MSIEVEELSHQPRNVFSKKLLIVKRGPSRRFCQSELHVRDPFKIFIETKPVPADISMVVPVFVIDFNIHVSDIRFNCQHAARLSAKCEPVASGRRTAARQPMNEQFNRRHSGTKLSPIMLVGDTPKSTGKLFGLAEYEKPRSLTSFSTS